MDRYQQLRLLSGIHGESSVTQKLNNLRTKEIRRVRNATRRGQLPEVARFTFNDPSLPTSVIAPSSSSTSLSPTPRAAPHARVRGRAFGFVTPPSWENHFSNTANNAARRAELEQTDGRELGTLGWDNVRDMTLKDRWQTFSGGWSAESFPLLFADPETFCASVALLPPYILSRISRYACVYQPDVFYRHLAVTSYLEEQPPEPDTREENPTITFFELVAGAEGELNYVGDGRSGRPVRRYLETYADAVKAAEAADSWDDSPPELPPGLPNAIQPSLNPLLHLHLADVPVSTFLSVIPLLPPTLIRLSVISLPHTKDRVLDTVQVDISRCLRKLSKQLPLLEVLDMSYNSWFRLVEQVQMVEWGTVWSALQTFIIRGLLSIDEIYKSREQRDRSNFGILFIEDWDNHSPGPPTVQAASMEINSKRKLGEYIKLGY